MTTTIELETPSVLIDLDIVERNIATMQQRCDELGIDFRPHIKTHKIPAIARMQIDAGAVGIACQKVSEAEIFVDAGFKDVQLPYNIVGARKTARLAQLARRAHVTVTADSAAVIDGIAEAAMNAGAIIHVMVELVGPNRRTGTTPRKAFELAQRIMSHNNLRFEGVMIYPSNESVRPTLQQALEMLNAAEIDVKTVSGGGTGAALEAHLVPELTELRVGTYVFNDYNCVTWNWATFDDCAMKVMAMVVSANEPDRVILDSGSKTLNAETRDGMFGYIVEYPEAKLYAVNEEHGFTDFTAYNDLPKVGDVVHIIPVHTCVVTNLHNQLYGVRGDEVVQPYLVEARGMVW